MNKVTRMALGVGLFLLLSGGILAVVGWLLGGDTAMFRDQEGGFSFSRPGVEAATTPPVVSHPAVSPSVGSDEEVDEFDSIYIEAGVANVSVVRGEQYGVSLSWNGKGYELGYRIEDGCLKVESQSEGKKVNVNVSGAITITVPGGTVLQEAEIYLGTGDITLQDQVVASQLTVNSGVGDVAISGELQGSMQIYTGVGDVSVSGVLGGDASMATGVGGISFTTSLERSAYDLEINTGLGSIVYNGETAETLQGGGGDFTLEADSGLGDITLAFGEAA